MIECRSRNIGQLYWMVLFTDTNSPTLYFHHKSSTTKTMIMIHTQRYMEYFSLPIHNWFFLVNQIGLRQKGITDLQCTHNKNTIGELECWSQA